MEEIIKMYIAKQSELFDQYLLVEDYILSRIFDAIETQDNEAAKDYFNMLKITKEIQKQIISILMVVEKYNTTVESERIKIQEIIEKILT